MPRSRAKTRRHLANLRAELHGAPWAIEARALGAITEAIQLGDLDMVNAALSFGREVESTTKLINGVAVIPVTGVLRNQVDWMVRYFEASAYQVIERDLLQALGNASVKGVLLYFDSPGGVAIGAKRVADLIFERRSEKPIRAYVQGVCCSAAYYLAAACERIEATADSLVGSIGTIFPHVEGSKMFEEFGLGYTVITNADSPKKGHGNIYEPLSDEAKATLQQYVDSYGRPFIEDVARYRGRSASDVINNFGQGDCMRADVGLPRGLVDAVVGSFEESLESLAPSTETSPVVTGQSQHQGSSRMNERIKAQLFAMGLIDSLEASDDQCRAVLKAWFAASGKSVPEDDAVALKALQTPLAGDASDGDEDMDDDEDSDEGDGKNKAKSTTPRNVQQAHDQEFGEARLADLRAAADLVNGVAGYAAVSSDMVLEAFEQKQDARAAMKAWKDTLAENETPLPTGRVNVTRERADQYALDVVDALIYRASDKPDMQISDGAARLVNRPLWAIAGECLQLAGQQVDLYGDREWLAEQAMTMGDSHRRHTFYSAHEGRQYVQASGVPYSRPGDFPNILSNLANKFLDTVQLDDDYSYPEVSAVLPGGLSDFKPAMLINKGIVEELDEVQGAEEFKQLGISEEVLSYIFLKRYGNKWGWDPVTIANDDLGAFVEGMIGLEEAWQVTQNRLVVDRFTANASLLDGSALFANRTDVGSAANNNVRGSGNPPDDTEWEAMEVLYADIGGINTARRVRGKLNVAYCPTGAVTHEAIRTFAPLNSSVIMETKQAATTANVGIFRGQVKVVPESELRASSAIIWYGLRNPTRLNTATVVRGYFNGFGQRGRRERWYDPTNKTTWVSIEGRIATAVKNWRYAVRNAGTGA